MRERISIVLLEEYERVNFYSFTTRGEAYSEFEKFLLKFKDVYPEDVGKILYRLECITRTGVFERHFRYAGRVTDGVAELPSHFETAKLRVYCLCISEKVLILGNGGLKSTRTYNEDPELDSFVSILQKIDKTIKDHERTGHLHINGKEMEGRLSMTIE